MLSTGTYETDENDSSEEESVVYKRLKNQPSSSRPSKNTFITKHVAAALDRTK